MDRGGKNNNLQGLTDVRFWHKADIAGIGLGSAIDFRYWHRIDIRS